MGTEIGGGYQPLFVEDTYKGVPLDPIAASVVRDMEREAARKKAGISDRDVIEATSRAFEPAIVEVKGAPMKISPDAEQRLAAIKGADSIASAIQLALEMPEMAQLAKANDAGFPVYQRVKEHKAWQMAGAMAQAGSVSHYANHVRLMAFSSAEDADPELRIQVVRHYAGNADYGSLWVHKTDFAYDSAYSDRWYALFNAGPSKVEEFFPKLTPAVLADYLRAAIATGRPPVDRG